MRWRQPFHAQTRFSTRGLFAARELKTLVARSRERFFMKVRPSEEAVLWERVAGFRVRRKTVSERR